MDCLPDSAEMEMYKGVCSSRTLTIWMCFVVKATALMFTEAIMWLIGIKTTVHKPHLVLFLKLKYKHCRF